MIEWINIPYGSPVKQNAYYSHFTDEDTETQSLLTCSLHGIFVYCSLKHFLLLRTICNTLNISWLSEWKKKQPTTQFTKGHMAGKRQNSNSSLFGFITYSYFFLSEIVQAHRRTEVTVQGTIEPFKETRDLTFWCTCLVCFSVYIHSFFLNHL